MRSLDVLLSAALGRDTNEIVLPSHCSSETISHVHYYATLTADSYVKLENLPIQLTGDYQSASSSNSSYWAFRDGRIILLPKPPAASTGYVRVFYQRRHPKLVVTTDNTAAITSATATTFTTAGTPSNWPSTTVLATVDIFSAYAPHRYYVTDLNLASYTATVGTITPQLDTTPFAEIAVSSGSIVTLAGTSDRVHLPPELRRPLTLRTASHIVRTIGDEARANSFLGEYRGMMASIQDSLMPRAKNSNQRIINQNSPLRSGRRGRRYL